MTSPPKAAPGARLSLHTILAFACLSIPATPLVLIMGVYMPRFYAGHMGVSLAAVGAAFTLVRLIDISFDPLVGMAMDRTRTFAGRYRPWVVAGAPILMFAIYKLFAPAAGVGMGYMVLWLVVLYLGNSMYTLGQAAWGAVLAVDYHQRSRTYGWMQAVGVAASVAFLLLPLLTHGRVQPGKHESMPLIGWLLVIAIPASLAVTLLFTPEKIAPQSARQTFALSDYLGAISRPEMRRIIAADLSLTLGPGTTGPIFLFFFHDAKGFSVAAAGTLLVFYIGAGLVGSPFWAALAKRLGKHRTVQLACVCYAVTQATLMALPRALYLPTAVGMFAVGFCASAFIPLVRAMVADVADEIRLETSKDLTSVLYSMVTTTAKIGAAISIGVIFPILALVGYQAADNVANTPHAIWGLEMCYLFAPIAFVVVGGAMFFGYRLDARRHAEVRSALERRDAMIDEGAALESLAGPTAAPGG
ncbi:MAG: MFS transporter [Caulobacteraceae bacterium]|nr:MFS transporter [Caulobacteraceae bacterium]